MRLFANGGAFTNGIVTEPTAFNMGIMGEAGSEAIMPLTNVNGKLGVNVVQSANDSNMNSEEELAELKKQNQILIAQNAILQEGFRQLINQNVQQNEHLDDISSTTRRQVNN
jgi:phage-related minor tail protein